MPGLNEEISRIVNDPLPPVIATELLSTIEAAGVLRAALQMGNFAPLAYEAILLDELKYACLIAGEEYRLYDLLTNASCRQLYERLTIATKYLEDKLSQHNLIPATDLLRISEFIRTGKQVYLQDTDFSEACAVLVQQTNHVLDIAYNNCYMQHGFIKIAVICCCLGFNKNIEPLALYALCSILINQDDTLPNLPLSVCRYVLLEGPFEGQAYPYDGEQSIVGFLRALRQIFVSETVLLHDIKSESERICGKIKEIIPRDSVDAIENILRTKLSFTGTDIQNATHVTYRTAFEYIRRLKNSEIIDSIRMGKENVYVSTQMLSRIERGLSDGTKKS